MGMAAHVTSGASCPLTKCRMSCSGGFEVNDEGCQICKCKQPRSIDEHADENLHENMIVEQRQGKKLLTRMGRSATADEYLRENMIVEQRQGKDYITRMGGRATCERFVRCRMSCHRRGGFKVTAEGCVLCACNGKTPRSIDEHAQEDLRGNEESNPEKRQSFLRFGRGRKTETAFKNIFKLARIPTQL